MDKHFNYNRLPTLLIIPSLINNRPEKISIGKRKLNIGTVVTNKHLKKDSLIYTLAIS